MKVKKSRIRKSKRKSHIPRDLSLRPNTGRTLTVNVSCFAPLITPATVTTDHYAAIPINVPTYWAAGPFGTTTTGFAVMPNVATVFANIGNNVFDSYRVKQLKVSWVPAQIDASLTQVDTPSIIYMGVDLDDMALPSTENRFQSDGILPRPFSSSTKTLSKIYKNSRDHQWYNLANAAITPGVNTLSNTNLSPQFYKAVKVCVPKCLGQTAAPAFYGRLYAVWTVEYGDIRFNV